MTAVRPLAWLALLLLAAAPAAVVEAAGTAGGLAVAVSADGSRLAAGGSNRALYELDPVTLAVKRRGYLGRNIQDMAFSPSGKMLIVESTKVVQWVAFDTFTVTKTLEQVSRMTPAPSAGLVAVNCKQRPNCVLLLDIETGAEKGRVAYAERTSLAAFTVSPDGKRVGLVYYRKRGDTETKVPRKDIPKDLKGAALNEFRQKHDGYTSRCVVVDVASGKPVIDKQLWYAPPGGGNIAYFYGSALYVVGYENHNARIDADGTVTYFELANGSNYARRASPDGAWLLTGGLRDATRTTVDGLTMVELELDQIPGFPEYFKNFTWAADGSAYAGTTASRVVRIGADGKVQAAQPVY